VLAVALGLYYGFHASLPNTSTWGDVAFLSFVLMPAVLGLVYLALPLRAARELQLILVAIAFAILAVILHQAELNTLADFAKLGAMAFAAFWFLNFFEALSWVVLVACIVPWVDAYSVWRGPTNHIVHKHHHVFSTLSFAFPVPGEESAANLGLPDLLFGRALRSARLSDLDPSRRVLRRHDRDRRRLEQARPAGAAAALGRLRAGECGSALDPTAHTDAETSDLKIIPARQFVSAPRGVARPGTRFGVSRSGGLCPARQARFERTS